MAAPSASEISAALLYPSNWWSGPTVTYSVAAAGSSWAGYGAADEPSNASYSTLNSQQAGQFAAAMAAWDKVLAISLVQQNDLASPGQIRVALTDAAAFQNEDVWGYAFSPPSSGAAGAAKAGDIWIDNARATSTFPLTSYDFMATIHEIGHALGLKHPFEEGATLPTEFDNHRYTVMSYTDNVDDVFRTIERTATGIRSVPTAVFATTPMVFDIAALQARYGADPATAAGPTTYSWSQATPIMQTVYDAGGIDTFDLSTLSRGSNVDLTPGAYSSIAYYSAEQQAADWTSLYPWAAGFLSEQFLQPSTYTWSQNVGIAYSTVIENVVGGSGADTVAGNDATNNIAGGAGDDTIAGGAGQDYLRGDTGNDRIAGGGDFDDINGNAGADTASGGAGNDWVVGGKDDDVLAGDDGNDIVYGNLGNDTVDGGAGDDLVRGGQDNDVLTGGDGNDWLSGDRGSDTLTGGAGADVFHTFGDAGVDRVTDFNLAQGDHVLLDPGTTYTVAQSGADTVISMGGGGQMVLVGVAMTSLVGDWISGA